MEGLCSPDVSSTCHQRCAALATPLPAGRPLLLLVQPPERGHPLLRPAHAPLPVRAGHRQHRRARPAGESKRAAHFQAAPCLTHHVCGRSFQRHCAGLCAWRDSQQTPASRSPTCAHHLKPCPAALPASLQWHAPSRSLFAQASSRYDSSDYHNVEGRRWPRAMHRPSDFPCA